jgi:hypothetical protein
VTAERKKPKNGRRTIEFDMSIAQQGTLACRLAARQHDLITRQQLIEAGISRRQVYLWQDSGFLTRVEREVFLVASGTLTWSARLLSVCLVSGAVASHRSAAVLHGVGGVSPGRPEITIPAGRTFRRGEIRVHESTDLHLIEPVRKDGIPATPVARTILDLGAVAALAVDEAARDAVARRLTTWPELLSTLVSHSRKGRRGCGPLRAVLDEHYGDQTESNLERRFLRLLRAANLPVPDEQVEVYDDDGFVMRLDFAYQAHEIAIELDSVQHHLTADAFQLDRRKRNRLRLAGWLLLEFTSDDVRRRPTLVCESVAGALAATGAPIPPSSVRQSPGG